MLPSNSVKKKKNSTLRSAYTRVNVLRVNYNRMTCNVSTILAEKKCARSFRIRTGSGSAGGNRRVDHGAAAAAAVSRSACPAITDPRRRARDDDTRPDPVKSGPGGVAGRGRILVGRGQEGVEYLARGVVETAHGDWPVPSAADREKPRPRRAAVQVHRP